MPLPSTIQAYQAQLDFMDRALDDEVGARVTLATQALAEKWRFKCNQARVLHRDQQKKVFEPTDKMYGCSEYDVLEFTIREDTEGLWWVYARKQILDEAAVEALSEIESDDDQTAA